MSLQSSPPGFNVDSTVPPDVPVQFAFNTKVLVGAIILLFTVICFILMLHFYARWFLRRSSQSYIVRRPTIAQSVQHNTGLDKATISQLPVFIYTAPSPVDDSEAGMLHQAVTVAAPECSVCLCEFQENEKGRMLPNCKHTFHTACIDMWLLSHSTCPLCRTKVSPAIAMSAETLPADQQEHQDREAMAGTTEGNSVVLRRAIEYPCNVLFWGNQTQMVMLQEPLNSSLPLSPSLHVAGARALPQITIDIPPTEGNLLVSTSVCPASTKYAMDQEPGSSQSLKSPSLRASIKRMLSRQSSRHGSPRQEGNEDQISK